MSYLDTTLTPAAGYTYVHNGQVYDTIAAQLAAHPGWSLVENVNWVSGGTTYEHHVWKCSAAVSLLTKDFYVIFRVPFTTATGLYSVNGDAANNVRVWLSEDYNVGTHTASRLAPVYNRGAYTLPADYSSDVSKVLGVDDLVGSTFYANGATNSSNTTAHRMIVGVTDAVIFLATGFNETYIGAMDSLLSSTDDPVPLIIGSTTTITSNSSTSQSISSTRHPLLTPGAQANGKGFGFAAGSYSSTGNLAFGQNSLLYRSGASQGGQLGDPTAGDLFLGGNILVSRCCISTNTAQGSAKLYGGLRGYFRHMIAADAAAHSFGDTFIVDGKAYVGLGSDAYGFWDTTA